MNSEYLYGFGLVITLIAAIGAQNIHLISHGMRRKYCFSVATICFLCDVVLIGIGVLGVGKALFLSFWLKKIIIIMGTIFLLYYTYRSLRSALSKDEPGMVVQHGNVSRLEVIWATLAVSLLNPHVYLDTVFLVGGASAGLGASARLAFMAGSLSASFLWFFGLGSVSYLLGPLLLRAGLWKKIEAVAGIIMFMLAFVMFKSIFKR